MPQTYFIYVHNDKMIKSLLFTYTFLANVKSKE